MWCDNEGRQRTGEMGGLPRECWIRPANQRKLEEARKILPYRFQKESRALLSRLWTYNLQGWGHKFLLFSVPQSVALCYSSPRTQRCSSRPNVLSLPSRLHHVVHLKTFLNTSSWVKSRNYLQNMRWAGSSHLLEQLCLLWSRQWGTTRRF